MGKATLALILACLACAVLSQEATTATEKVPETTTMQPTRLPPQPTTSVPDLVHKVNETVQNATAEAEKNVQKSFGAQLAPGLVLAVSVLCAWF